MKISWLPPPLLKSTVMMLRLDRTEGSYSWNEVKNAFIGTGFLVVYNNIQFLVSNRHVVTKYPQGHPRVPRTGMALAYENRARNPELFSIELNQKQNSTHWFFPEDDELDLAVTPIGIQLEKADITLIVFGTFESIRLGEDIFFIGFPLGIKS